MYIIIMPFLLCIIKRPVQHEAMSLLHLTYLKLLTFVHVRYKWVLVYLSFPPAPPVPDNTTLIIGVVVAVVIVFLLAIVVGFIIVLVCMKRKDASESIGGRKGHKGGVEEVVYLGAVLSNTQYMCLPTLHMHTYVSDTQDQHAPS